MAAALAFAGCTAPAPPPDVHPGEHASAPSCGTPGALAQATGPASRLAAGGGEFVLGEGCRLEVTVELRGANPGRLSVTVVGASGEVLRYVSPAPVSVSLVSQPVRESIRTESVVLPGVYKWEVRSEVVSDFALEVRGV